jgi:Flp pilus assembly protein TadG
MVEFALVAPVFFFVIFAMIDGGFLLFSVNAVDQATTVGSNSIAALGKASNADTLSLQRMVASSSLGATSLITISEVDIEKLVTNSSGDGFATNSDGTPQVDATGCNNAPCIDKYTFSGRGPTATVVMLPPTPVYTTQCASGDPSGCPPWAPQIRNVYNGQSDFVALKVTYTYNFFTGIAPQARLTTTKAFRLEPQNAPGT